MFDKAKRDPLLAIARIGATIVNIFIAIGMIAFGVFMTLTVIGGPYIAKNLTPEALKLGVPVVQVAMIFLTSLGIAALACMFTFVKRLCGIIDTVGQGDPFTPGNASSLDRMAWLAIAVQIAIPSGILSGWLKHQFVPNHFGFHAGFSFNGLVLGLVLFILARVFRKGAEMREELEGTV